MHWQRTVNRIVEVRAQQEIERIAALAIHQLVKQDDARCQAEQYRRHRTNEHSQAKQEHCRCELCMVYDRIEQASSLIRNSRAMKEGWSGWYSSIEGMSWRQFMRNVNGHLFREHNLRRRLMGLPEKTFQSMRWREVPL